VGRNTPNLAVAFKLTGSDVVLLEQATTPDPAVSFTFRACDPITDISPRFRAFFWDWSSVRSKAAWNTWQIRDHTLSLIVSRPQRVYTALSWFYRGAVDGH